MTVMQHGRDDERRPTVIGVELTTASSNVRKVRGVARASSRVARRVAWRCDGVTCCDSHRWDAGVTVKARSMLTPRIKSKRGGGLVLDAFNACILCVEESHAGRGKEKSRRE